jgi:hypothetical protein
MSFTQEPLILCDMNVGKNSAFYEEEYESIGRDKEIINKNESNQVVSEQGNDMILLEEADKKERLLSVLLADIKWTINSEGKVSYISPYQENCIGNDAKYLIKKIASKYLPQSSVMACLIELEEFLEMIRTSKNIRQHKLIVDTLKNENDINKVEISSSAIFDTQGNVVGIQGLCKYLK